MSVLISQGKIYSKSVSAHVDYPDTGGVELTDGLVSGGAGYGGVNGSLYDATLAVTIDLSQVYVLDYARFHYQVWGAGAAAAAAQVVIEGSNDGSSFTAIATYTRAAGYWASIDGPAWSNSLPLSSSQYRYVRFTFTRSDSYQVFSEIEVYVNGVPGTTVAVLLSDYGVM